MNRKKCICIRSIVTQRLIWGLTVIMLILMMCSTISVCAEKATAATSQILSIGNPVEENPELFVTRSMPTHGEGKIAVFLIAFPDYPNKNPVATQEYYDKLYFSGGIETIWGETTVADFYKEQSYDKLNLSGQVFDWYTAKHERSYYDDRKAELVMEAAEYHQSKGTDFSQFDGDSDGVIDSIVYHFAGMHSDDMDDPWHGGIHYSTGSGYYGQVGDIKFTNMIQVHEGAENGATDTISTICHELMHSLGMPDLYGKVYFGMRPTHDLMSDNYETINPYTKILLGWLDTIQVITGDANNIKLMPYGTKDTGNVVIVTDEFNGLFDEFYIVAYRDFWGTNAVIWHIDARLNENGTSFAYQNLLYDPRPDKDNPHNTGNVSTHLFIEELTADPDLNFILANGGSFFTESSVLGPNSTPSSDTHDGEYTGIQISNFVEYDAGYLTFDVSFIEDTTAPKVTTKDAELGFKETIWIKFNEYIYAGDNWDQIQVTDIEGNPIDTIITLPHYPHHELEIVFTSESYKNGYNVILPEGCLRDSSGNTVDATTLTASKITYFTPIDAIQLPNAGEWTRSRPRDNFFPEEDNFVVITDLWVTQGETHVSDAKIEFMRLDYNGNVLLQTIIDNPFVGYAHICEIKKTEDGCYLVFLADDGRWDLLLCLDQNGNLKWKNRDYHDTGSYFHSGTMYSCENGLITYLVTEADTIGVCIRSDTGEIEFLERKPIYGALNLQNGKLLRTQTIFEYGAYTTLLEIIDAKTHEVEMANYLANPSGSEWILRSVQANDDGTIMLFCEDFNDARKVFLLDASLNVIKSVSLEAYPGWGEDQPFWFTNDGFIEVIPTVFGNHDNDEMHIHRYDRYLNLIWETDIVCYDFYFFKTPAGGIIAYKPIISPENACFIEFYGSEDRFKTEHVHNLVHTKMVSATCTSDGVGEYWVCSDCGCWYSDEGQTLIRDVSALIIPARGHFKITIPGVPATCATVGTTAGTKCSACGEIFDAPQHIPATREHTYSEWIVMQEYSTEVEETRICTICSATEYRTLEKPKTSDTKLSVPLWCILIITVVVVCFAFLKRKQR